MRGQAAEQPGRQTQQPAGLGHHRRDHAKRGGHLIVALEGRRQVVELKLVRAVEGPVRAGQPGGRRRGRADGGAGVRPVRVGEAEPRRPLDRPGQQVPVRHQQLVPDVLRPAVVRVAQREAEALDAGLRVEAVQAALVARELHGHQHVPVRAGWPGPGRDRVPDPEFLQLGPPGPVPVPGEPGVRVPGQVRLGARGAQEELSRCHQPLLAGGRVLPGQEPGDGQLLGEFLPGRRGRAHQGLGHLLHVGQMLGLVQAVHGQPAVRRIPGQHGSKHLGHRIRRTKPERLEEPPGGRDRGQRRMHHRQPVFPARPARHRTGSRPAGAQRTAARQAGAKRAVAKETVARQAVIRPPGIRRASVNQTCVRQIGVWHVGVWLAVAGRADRGTGSRKEHGGLPGRVERRHLAAISQPDDGRGPGRSRRFASRAEFPQIRVPVQEPVQLRDPLVRLAHQELSSQPRGERLRGDQLSAGRVEQEPPQAGRGLSRHRRAGQHRRPSQRAMRFGARRQGG